MDRKEFVKMTSILGLISTRPLFELSEDPVLKGGPLLTRPVLSNSYWYIGHLMSVIISSKDTGGSFSLIHGFEIQGLEPPPHTHTKEDESFYLLDGEVEYRVGSEVFLAQKGDWVFLPRNIQHSFRVITEKAEVLIHFSPGGFEEYFIQMSDPAREMVIPPKPQGPPDLQKIIETSSRFGVLFPEK